MLYLRLPVLSGDPRRYVYTKGILEAAGNASGGERQLKRAIAILDKIQKPLLTVIILLGAVGFLIELMSHLLTSSPMTMAWVLPSMAVAIIWVVIIVADVALSMVSGYLDGNNEKLRK
ncbi:hypothetical protein [Bifidobacterium breve]|uniref:hypothetical protein n=1 Tax=Bifidobacterium breve TaxID=1685 RepID=UPI00254DBE64|nr:hypothetical protein [Bifidobacterium breve]MDK8732604.1 hypothetical protein [Bifidobacterium breve]